MTKEIFLITSLSIQGVFVLGDIVDRCFQRSPSLKEEPFKPQTLVFLILMILLYGGIQMAGLALIPKTEILIEGIRGIIPEISFLRSPPPAFTSLGWVLLGIAGFYVAGFWDYMVHRFLSHSRFLWFTHEYHHLPNQFFLALPGFCVRPFLVVAVFPSTLGTLLTLCWGLSLLGYTELALMPLIYSVILVKLIILLATHSSWCLRLRWMHHLFKWVAVTTPQEHELHHTVDLQGNFGNFTTLWDRVLGTYLDPTREENRGHRLGLAYDQDFLGAITMGKLKLSPKLRKYFQVDRYCNIQS